MQTDHPMERTQIVNLKAYEERSKRVLIGWVVAMNGPLAGHDFRLWSERTLIGTGADCDVVLTDPHVSQRHCTVSLRDGEAVIVDLDSRNGTWLNGKRVDKHFMINDDKLRLGNTLLRVKLLC